MKMIQEFEEKRIKLKNLKDKSNFYDRNIF